MCSKDEVSQIINIAAQPDCNPSQVVKLLKNASREIASSDLSSADREALRAASEEAKRLAVTNFQQLLETI